MKTASHTSGTASNSQSADGAVQVTTIQVAIANRLIR